MTLPNFIIIGQMRAGTTSLYEYLKQHPSIFMPEDKEQRFFTHPIDIGTGQLILEVEHRRRRMSRGLPVSLEDYQKNFSAKPTQSICGEASPEYLNSELAARQIAALLPDAKLIVSIRRPSERVFSYYQMVKQAPFRQDEFLRALHSKDAISWRDYNFSAPGLTRFYSLFGANRIFPIRFEDLSNHTLTTVQSAYRFLRVDPGFSPSVLARYNPGRAQYPSWLGRLKTSLKRHGGLKRSVRQVLPTWLWRYGKAVERKSSGQPESAAETVRREIAQFYKDDTLKIQDLTGWDLSDWLER